MRYGVVTVVAFITLSLVSVVALFVLNPLRRSEGHIREWLLTQAPLGSPRNEVLVLVKKRGWKLHTEYRGRFINGSLPTGGFGTELGSYIGWPDVIVDAYWQFSVNDRLTEVYVNKWSHNF